MADYAVDSVAVKVSSQDNHIQIDNVAVKRQENSITATATYDVPADNQWLNAPMHLDFTLNAPNLTAFNAEPALKGVNGVITANGSVASDKGVYNGTIGVKGSKFAFNEFTADSLDIDVAIANSVANIRTVKLLLNPVDQIAASANVDLRPPYHYSGALAFNVKNLSAFTPVLKASGVKDTVAGSLGINWQGSGEAQGMHHTGEIQLKMQNGQFGEIKPIDIALGGSYSPETINVPTFHINTNRGNLQARIDLKDSLLKIHDILFQQGSVGLLSGSLQIPLDFRNPKDINSLLPSGGPIAVNLVSKDIQIEPLLKPLHGDAPAKGVVTTTITASGSLDQLAADVHLQARDLQAKAAAKLAPATLDLDINLKDDRLALNGVVRQAKISPLEVKGSLPLPVKKLLQEKKIDEQSPVQLSIKLARTPAAFISDIVPAIRFAQGDISLDANVGGTLAKPAMSGSALLDIPAIRFLAQNLPAISGFKGNISFSGNRLTISRLGGDLSGGSFDLTGGIQIPNLAAPMQSTLDLSLKSKGALLLRNDTITARADADIRVTGTLEKAHVAGTVGVTKSKFFREIDILPLQLPGRPAPKPPAPSITTVSFPNPPLRDCTFDIAIKTKDPFLVRGNLANGAVVMDLKLGGTGLTPSLVGTVRIENFVASLPFSKLKITTGYVYFNDDNPFIPQLDMQGTSNMRDYNITVYISGSAYQPQTVLSSEPPLTQQDIVSLLATGATTQELTGNGDVLAGRAASLLFQKVYRKFFKSKSPSENESFADKISVDAGGIDPRTGKQEVTSTVKLSDKVQVQGGLDVQGYLRGEVKYLIRFR